MTSQAHDDAWRLSVVEIDAALARRDLSPVELVRACRARAERLNPRLNALITLDPSAELAAGESERRRREGRALSPLDGVPIAVKDSLLTAGLRTTWGSRVFEDFVPAKDELPVARLRAAGAVIVGKTNVPEFTLDGYTSNGLFGTTGNPWNPALTPGGSSGGSVAAVAGGIVPAALGTDGGGSIRRPAGYTGLVGLKSTIGRVPRQGGFPHILLDMEVAGALTRTVADTALLFEAMAGPHDEVPNSLGFAKPEVGLEEAAKPLRIRYVERFADAPLDPAIARSVHGAVEALAELGHEVETGRLPFDIDPVTAVWSSIGQTGLASVLEHHAQRRSLAGERYLEMAADGGRLPAHRYFDAIERIRQLRADVARAFEAFDVLVTPSCAAQPWPADQLFPPEIDGVPAGPRGHAVYTGWVNAAGVPAINLPAEPAPDGMPIGFQLVGRFGADELLLRLARQYELARPWSDRWPEIALAG